MEEQTTKTVQQRLTEKAAELRRAQSEVSRIEDELAEAKKIVEGIEREMPEIMEEAEMASFSDLDGNTFTINEKVFVNLLAEDRQRFYQWCEQNNLGGLIKSTIEIPIAKGKVKLACQLMEVLSEGLNLGDEVVQFQSGRTSKIEPATLSKLARERLTNGEAWPTDMAKISIVKTVKVKEPKKKK